MQISWTQREPPLPAQGLIARDHAVRALLTSLCQRTPEALSSLRGVMTPGAPVCVLLGALERLPWVDGVVYVGRPPHTNFYLPTTTRAGLSDALLGRILQGAGDVLGPIAVLPEPDGCGVLISLARARPLTLDVLERHLKALP